MDSNSTLGISLPVKASSAGLFISRGQGTHPTRLIDSCELIFVRSGKLAMFEENRQFTVHAGQALLLQAGRRHGGSAPYAPDLSLYWIHFHIRPAKANSRPVHTLRLPSLMTVSRPDRLTELYRHYLDDQETGRLTPASADLMMTLILSEFADTVPTSGMEVSTTLANRADQFIRRHFNQPLSTSMIAAALRCNGDYLGRVFQKAYGCTLTSAIHKQRHQKARSLLLDDKLSIKEIALACGFDEAVYFRRLFRRREGLSPTAYRRLYAHMHVNY